MWRLGIVGLLLVGLTGCNGVARARIRVLSTQEGPIAGALVRLDGYSRHDLARFTDDSGCASFGGVVAPVRHVDITIGKAGYRQQRYRLPTSQDNCLVVRLAPDGSSEKGGTEALALDSCPCGSDAGSSPKMAARFKVTASASPVAGVALRQTDEPHLPFSQVTDDNGCLGVTWIVPASRDSIPLVLEHSTFLPAQVLVPTRGEHCYAVHLGATGRGDASTVVEVPTDACGCEMFSGRTVFEK